MQSRTRRRRAAELPLTKFYDSPKPAASAKPGALIRAERTDDYFLSTEASTIRILYNSQSPNGELVAVSGVVVVPARPSPPGGWPVINWAHGLEGVARDCAPSLHENLEEASFFSMYINLGYALIATDYAGLGTSSRNAYMDSQSNAFDLINAVPAARSAVPQLGTRWIAMGIAEGGLAAAKVAEVENEIRDSNYLGSVALSGLIDSENVVKLVSHQSSQGVVSFIYGVKTLFPRFQIADVLTEKGLQLYQHVADSCKPAQDAAQTPATETLKPNWQQNEFVRKFVERNTLGQHAAYRPLLVLASETDPVISITQTNQAVERLCGQGDRVQFYHYASPNPKAVIGDSAIDQLGWIQALFANQAAVSSCP